MNAHRARFCDWGRALFSAVLFIAGADAALAKLPPPSAEAQAASEKKAAEAKVQLLKQQEALTQVQDQVVERYRSDLVKQGKVPPKPTPIAQPTATKDLPKVVAVPPRSDGPRGGTTPSAEAHSAPAK